MLSEFYKIMPYFIVEYLAKKYCEKFEEKEGFISVNAFKNTAITCKK